MDVNIYMGCIRILLCIVFWLKQITDRGAAGEHVDPGPEETYARFQAIARGPTCGCQWRTI